jgi:hypothetical protein
MALEVLADAELDAVNGGWGVSVNVNPQINVQGAQIAFHGDNVAFQNNSSGNTLLGSNSGIIVGALFV